jgi:hypothetical protein
MKMSTTTQLFIRACKRPNSKVRLLSIMKRFYLGYDNTLDYHSITGIICHLGDIVDQYVPMKSIDLIAELNPINRYTGTLDERDYKVKALDTLINRIAHSRGDKFGGLRSPCWLANRNKKGLLRLGDPSDKEEK